MRNFHKKYFRFCAKKIVQNRAKLIAFHAQKLRKSSQKKNLKNLITQILRENSASFAQKYSHFVETLIPRDSNYLYP